MSKQKISLMALTFKSALAVAAFRAIAGDGAQATAPGQKVVGVSHAAAVADENFAADVIGTTIIETGAAIAINDSLIVDSQGRAIPSTGALNIAAGAVAVTGTAANGAILAGGDMPEYVFADPLQIASASGQFIEVLLRR